MMYKIMQIERAKGIFHEELVREFEELDKAEKFLIRLARKQRWKLKQTTGRLRYSDEYFNREYYITDRELK